MELMAALCLCLLTQPIRPQAPVSILLDNVRQFANKVVNYDAAKQISAAFADDVFKQAKQASLAVDKAVAAGVPDSRAVTLNTGNSEKSMTLAEIKDMCARVARVAAISNAEQAITNASNWPRLIADGTINQRPQARGALDAGKFCVAKVDEALANGVPDSTVVEALDRKMTLAEGREMCVYVRDEAQKVVEKQTAAEEAQYEPIRRVLSDDKLRVFNDRLKRYKVYGAGGKVLRTPEEYRDSPLWCTSGVNRDGIIPIWSVDCWHFKGMAKAGAVTTRTGEGDQAPSSAFR
jgi:hypothetical protein